MEIIGVGESLKIIEKYWLAKQVSNLFSLIFLNGHYVTTFFV